MRIKRLPLLVELDFKQPLARQIYNGIRQAIVEGRVRAGDPLPSSRDLAKQFGVSRNTVLSAINALADDSFVEARRGAGVFIATQSDRETPAPRIYSGFALTPWAEKLPTVELSSDFGYSTINFRPGLPDLNAFPFDDWRRSSVRKFKTLRGRIGLYGAPEGDEQLRTEIARYVARSRAVACGPDDVIITSGAQQAFDLIARILIQCGTKVAMEDPGYRPASYTFVAAGADLQAIPIDEEGIEVNCIPPDSKIIYTTPSHQYPTSITMSDRRRRELISWANEFDAYIIEDDYDSEYRYTNDSLPSLQGSDPAGRVIYVGTFSKNLMPGIRLGYLIAPRSLREALIKAKWLSDRHCDNISQSVLSEFMSSGGFSRHLVKMQKIYSERRSVLNAELLKLENRDCKIYPSVAGLHVCVGLSSVPLERMVLKLARDHGVTLYGLSGCFHSQPKFGGLILGFGGINMNEIRGGVNKIRNILNSAALASV